MMTEISFSGYRFPPEIIQQAILALCPVHAHCNLIMNVAQFLSFSGDNMRESDHVLTALPLYHVFAFTVNFLGFFIRGAHNILIPSPRPLTNLRKAPMYFCSGKPMHFSSGVDSSIRRPGPCP